MKNNIYVSILIITAILFSTIIWNKISINFGDTQILGEYYSNSYHALNDPLRFVTFIFIPIAVYLLFKIFFEKKKINFDYIKFENSKKKNFSINLFILNLLIIIFLLFEFFSISFPLNQIDIFHEGQKLSAPFKSLIDKKLWSGSFVTTGIINESLGIKSIWKILEHQSIGSMRYLQLVYILLFKISLIVLIYQVVKNSLFRTDIKLVYFLIITLISLVLIDYDLNSGDSYSYRDLPIIVCLILFIKYLDNFKQSNLPLIFIGLLSIVTFFWSIDRALVNNLLIILICIHILINREFKNFFTILISVIFFWYLFYFYLGDEFQHFVDNTLSIFKNQNYVHGLIHPQPFSDMPDSSRATRSLLLIILSMITSLSFLFYEKKKYNNNFKVIIVSLSFICFCSYLYALGRSDGGHIKQTSGTVILFFSFFISFYILKFFDNFFLKRFFNINLSYSLSIILLMIFIFNLKINIKNILDYSSRFNQSIYLEDKNYLSDEQNYLVQNLKPLISKYECIQLFTYDAALPYILQKPNCSKYYFIYSLGSIEDQKALIEDLRNIEFVIYRGQTDNWGLSPQKKLTIVDKYINLNFINSKEILNWEIKYR